MGRRRSRGAIPPKEPEQKPMGTPYSSTASSEQKAWVASWGVSPRPRRGCLPGIFRPYARCILLPLHHNNSRPYKRCRPTHAWVASWWVSPRPRRGCLPGIYFGPMRGALSSLSTRTTADPALAQTRTRAVFAGSGQNLFEGSERTVAAISTSRLLELPQGATPLSTVPLRKGHILLWLR